MPEPIAPTFTSMLVWEVERDGAKLDKGP